MSGHDDDDRDDAATVDTATSEPQPGDPEHASVALTPERRLLVESVTGYAAALALTVAEDVGSHWLPDLRAAAWLGACEAARRYSFESKASFTTFAWFSIFGAMIHMLRKERVRLRPELAAMLEKAAAAIESGLDHAVHVHDKGSDELQEEVDGAAAAVAVGLLCLGAAPRDPEALLLREERHALVRRALSCLAERDREVVSLRYFEGLKFQVIADRFGVHEDTARKRHKDAMRRLGAVLRPLFG